jgi:hypothetical protein
MPDYLERLRPSVKQHVIKVAYIRNRERPLGLKLDERERLSVIGEEQRAVITVTHPDGAPCKFDRYIRVLVSHMCSFEHNGICPTPLKFVIDVEIRRESSTPFDREKRGPSSHELIAVRIDESVGLGGITACHIVGP